MGVLMRLMKGKGGRPREGGGGRGERGRRHR
jgi:hypothetical protein